MNYHLALACSLLALTACDKAPVQTAKTLPLQVSYADAIYYGGDILTMTDDKPEYAQAIATKGEKIIFVGNKDKALEYKFGKTKLIDLQGKTLMPGFVDGHSHVYGVGLQAMVANVLPSPDGDANSVEQIVNILKAAQHNPDYTTFIEKTGAILGFGYDDAELDRYPTKMDLDLVSTDKPVIIIHTSGHLSVANSKALAMAGIDASTKNPDGGLIRRMPNSQEPSGVLEENAHFALLFKLMQSFDPELQDMMLEEGQKMYTKYGYTTAQEGRATQEAYDSMVRASKANKFVIDVVAYADMATSSSFMNSTYNSKDYTNHFRIGGVKLNFDGSPQGKTAWLTHPYLKAPEGQEQGYAGYPTFSDEQAYKYVETAFANGWQVMTHANGDAAIEQFLNAVENANNKLGRKDRRPVLIHGQTIRQDQVNRLKELGVFPSLFPMHTFYWGDWHVNSVLGHPRADFISPTHAVRKQGLMFSTHHDAPVALPNALRVLDATVNRTTRTDQVLGPEQRVSVYTALQAMTIWPAYQHFEETSKGQLKQGMQADLIILDNNPLKIKPAELHNLHVLETISRGKTVYSKN
ncbi:amidohydrolase [Pseudoalteromonas sp. L21]|uniref:amidohydrolase n=1 Tax=Pseudoalteromonas sp. L21 TaxID=1539746 RepID=UPI001F323348|nr:amidohydrolase [Pseudoalteromonas sp. L21]MCF7517798.1 amidohydrolase [Pseudoalteromonas sp. L21]